MRSIPLQFDAAGLVVRGGGYELLRLDKGWSAVADPAAAGLFLRWSPAEPAPWCEVPLGRVPGLRRFTSIQRFSAFWTQPALGRSLADVRPETLWWMAQLEHGAHLMLVPLINRRQRASLLALDGQLGVAVETGDPALSCSEGVMLFVACGTDPYALLRDAAQAVSEHLGSGRLLRDKPVPDFVDDFGWCTWDAFYKDVTPDKVLQGLQSLHDAGVPPKLLILDDGWQQWQRGSGGEDRLLSLEANARFGTELAPLVQEAKQRFGVRRVMVWHALLGYWGGLSAQAFPSHGVRDVPKSFSPGLLAQQPRWNVWPWGALIGVPAADAFQGFYDGWHRRLAAQGVDGVKVDAQGLLEAVSTGQGGRVVLAAAARQALEASTRQHFQGRLINCMACTQEVLYQSAEGSVLRTSDDFFPDRPASHGQHLHVNAVAGLWLGEFMLPDWDMFHSQHPRGAFHAAARAISGGPVYVSDKPGAHDAKLLRKLVLSDGTVLRADGPGRVSPDSLYTNPLHEPVLLKVFNHNRDGAAVGLFHVHDGDAPLTGHVGPADAPGLDSNRRHIAWAHQSGRLWCCQAEPQAAFTLPAGGWELVTLAPVEQGLAIIGLADKFNSAGAITRRAWQGRELQVALRDGGQFLAWCAARPLSLQCDGQDLPFDHDPSSGALRATLPTGGARIVRIKTGL